jgi:hypothetical protein
MPGGSSHDRRKAGRASQQASPDGARSMPSTTADKKSFKVLWLGIFWATGLTLVVTLVSAAGLMTQLRVVLLSIFGAVCFSLAVHLHGWTKSRTQAIWQLSIIVIAMGVLGWQALPRPKLAVVEMRISP